MITLKEDEAIPKKMLCNYVILIYQYCVYVRLCSIIFEIDKFAEIGQVKQDAPIRTMHCDILRTGWISYWGNDDRHWVWLR